MSDYEGLDRARELIEGWVATLKIKRALDGHDPFDDVPFIVEDVLAGSSDEDLKVLVAAAVCRVAYTEIMVAEAIAPLAESEKRS